MIKLPSKSLVSLGLAPACSALILFSVFGCRGAETSPMGDSVLMMDLGSEGNVRLEKDRVDFRNALQKSGVIPNNGLPTVYASGFTPFGGEKTNASGDATRLLTSERAKVFNYNGTEVRSEQVMRNGQQLNIVTQVNPVNPEAITRSHEVLLAARPLAAVSQGESKSGQWEAGGRNYASTSNFYNADGSVSQYKNTSTRMDEAQPRNTMITPNQGQPVLVSNSGDSKVRQDTLNRDGYLCQMTEGSVNNAINGKSTQLTSNTTLKPLNSNMTYAFHHDDKALTPQANAQIVQNSLYGAYDNYAAKSPSSVGQPMGSSPPRVISNAPQTSYPSSSSTSSSTSVKPSAPISQGIGAGSVPR